MLALRESDAPRTLSSKLVEYVQKPAFPSLRFLKDGVKVSAIPGGGRRVDFSIRQGTPIPIVY